MNQTSITLDCPEALRDRVEKLAESLSLMRIRNGVEAPNLSAMARMLIEASLAYPDFRVNPGERDDCNKVSITLQVSETQASGIGAFARHNGFMKKEWPEDLPNTSEAVRRLLEFSLDNPDVLNKWFEARVLDFDFAGNANR